MSETDQSGAGRREVAYRLFAAEFDDADFSYSESDEERAPNYVVTPTGARINRLFAVGVLTEVEAVSDEVLRGRVVDPTGAFVLYAGQYQPDERAFLDGAETPAFVAVTGKARTFQPDDSQRVFTSVRPETISEVDAPTRDRWTVRTAERTVERVGHAASALALDSRGDELRETLVECGLDEGLAAGIALALDHYDTSPAYLAAVREMALDAARVVAGERDELDPVSIPPDAAGEADLEALAASTDTASAGEDDGVTAGASTDTGSTGSAAEETQAASEPTTSGADTAASGETEADAATSDQPVEATASGGTETPTANSAADEDTPEPESVGAGDDGEPTEQSDTESDGDIGDFEPGEFELDEKEREEIEKEYGTEFQSGTEVDEPGEADIGTPDSEASAGSASTEPQEPAADATGADGGETETDSGDDAAPGEGADPEEVDLTGAVVDAMERLDDGSGAPRDAVVESVAETCGASTEAIEEAIQDALMDGQCYEPDDATLKAI